jgi:hypothetical protein
MEMQRNYRKQNKAMSDSKVSPILGRSLEKMILIIEKTRSTLIWVGEQNNFHLTQLIE